MDTLWECIVVSVEQQSYLNGIHSRISMTTWTENQYQQLKVNAKQVH